ncbi:hypothetical protein ACIA6C_27975 [Streptomyces sp. NPDC051578]
MTKPQPARALDAAHRLVAAGQHVHYVADGAVRCLSGHCTQPAA